MGGPESRKVGKCSQRNRAGHVACRAGGLGGVRRCSGRGAGIPHIYWGIPAPASPQPHDSHA